MGFVETITVVGTLATLVALGFTLYHVIKTKGAVKAAQDAIMKTEKKIQGNVLIADVSTLIGYIESIKAYIRSDDFKPALIRLGDLKSQLARLKHITQGDKLIASTIKSEMRSLSEIEVKLEKELASTLIRAVDKPATYEALNRLSEVLNETIGREIYKLGEDKT